MNMSRMVENRITRQLLQRRQAPSRVARAFSTVPAERMICLTASIAGLLLIGSWSQELLAVLLASCTVLALGLPSNQG